MRDAARDTAHAIAAQLASHFGLSQSWIVYAVPFIKNDLARHSLKQVVESWARKLNKSAEAAYVHV